MNLQNLGVQEMNAQEVISVDGATVPGGNPFINTLYDEPANDGPGSSGICSQCVSNITTTQGAWQNGTYGWVHLLFH